MKRQIEATTTLRAPVDRARDVIRTDPGCVFAERCSAEDRKARRFHASLHVDARGGGLHQEIVVETGIPDSTADQVVVPVHWRAATHERLFPTFDGALELHDDGLRTQVVLRGSYVAPLGVAGRVGDRVAGRRAAYQSLTSFVQEVARRLDGEVDRRMESISFRPAPYHVDVRDVGPDNYIG